MARKKKARPSTDELPFADYAWKVLDEPVPGHLRAWGLAPGASFEDLEARWSDPQRVQRKLAELPPLAIAALEDLFHAGGEAVANALASRMSRRLGAPIGQVALACDSLVDAGVVLAVRYTRSTSAQHRLLAVRPFADVALPFVRGVTAPREPVVPRHRVLVEDEEISLTALEFKLLLDLASRRGRVQPRDSLLERVWGYAPGIETRTVDTHVKRLREKLAGARDYIETVRGVGYRMRDE